MGNKKITLMRSNEFIHLTPILLEAFIAILVNQSGEIIKANKKFLRSLNYSLKDLENVTIGELINVNNTVKFLEQLTIKLHDYCYWSGQIMIKNKANQTIDSNVRVFPWNTPSEESTNYLFLITPLNNERLIEMAYTDELTGLPNYRKFREVLQMLIEKNKQQATKFALLFIDIDHFKEINDTFGHLVGDQLLKEFGCDLTKSMENNSYIFRKSGDEFLMIVEDIAEVKNVFYMIQQQCAHPYYIKNHRININISIGISIFPDHGSSEYTLLESTDRSMYENKKTRTSFIQL
ncbi:sensor domain-containing diguanylate cyclase [Bacillus sp. FJAT-50079]|uniref:GGDEF domain-containing protein n=1 Tax=Bacillus sp. FJAT-50079 TaxID=2833577 RepID=UPI001BCA1824|nr:sensor domain-containing diguanylate cyclase [Bacillus sp. FJAT-50079]MBS4210466.1 sensor domain-containing diguanylate cyclase [Bacillus sp. FJAT-50079]